jgi:hypothetical protein
VRHFKSQISCLRMLGIVRSEQGEDTSPEQRNPDTLYSRSTGDFLVSLNIARQYWSHRKRSG